MKLLLKKIFFVLITGFIFTVAKTQIIYTDVNPDSTIGNGPLSYNLDLNNDGIPDFTITDSSRTISCRSFPGIIRDRSLRITPLGSNAVLSNSVDYPYFLLPNYAIASDSATWLSTPNQTLYQYSYNCSACGRGSGNSCITHIILGNWFPVGLGWNVGGDGFDGFVGLKLVKGGNTYYGWVRLSAINAFVIDYAYNSVVGQPILTQEGATAFPEQGPPIAWQESLGGSAIDAANSVQLTPDGGYIVAGYSGSTDGDVAGIHASTFYSAPYDDYWVVKLSSTGSIQWQKSLGGSGEEQASSIKPTSDDGYILAGYSTSNDGDVTGNHGSSDYWVVKLSSAGNIQWQKSLGGSGNDFASSIQPTSDGGYILAGNTNSSDGDVTGLHPGLDIAGNPTTDYWIVKLDNSGNMIWQKALGGSGTDVASSIKPTPDGGFIVAGNSASNDGDVSGNHGSDDSWIVKLDGSGNILWQKSLGGSGEDGANDIQVTPDGGYIVAGWSGSSDGDVTGNHGDLDYWIVKLSSNGSIQWQKSLGGSSGDAASSIQLTSDGGYIVVGNAGPSDGDVNLTGPTAVDGDITGNHGYSDYWVVKLNSTGSIQWQKSLGGSGQEGATGSSIQLTPDNGYIMVGTSDSYDYDVTGAKYYPSLNYWIVKLGLDVTLPLRLLSFTGILENNTSKLNWQTTNEINTADFIVERSDNATNFSLIGKLNAKNTSVTTNSYTFTDDAPSQGMNYYRLKMEDIDGKFTYSNVVRINNNNQSKLTIAPNPISNSTNISFSFSQSQEVSIQIFDIDGRLIKTLVNSEMPAGAHQINWDATNESGSTVANGTYYLKFNAGNYMETKKLSIIK